MEVVEGSNGSGFTIGVVQPLAESSAAVALAMTSITLAMTPVLEGQAVRGNFALFPTPTGAASLLNSRWCLLKSQGLSYS